jgi:hypothetical protein
MTKSVLSRQPMFRQTIIDDDSQFWDKVHLQCGYLRLIVIGVLAA